MFNRSLFINVFQKLNTVQIGIALALIGYSGFAISDASAKFLTGRYEPLVIVSYIMLTSSVILACLSPWLGGRASIKPNKSTIKVHVLRGFMNFLVSVTIVNAFALLPLATIYTIVFAMPFIATMLAIPIYKEHVPITRWGAIILGFGGVVIAMRPSAAGIDLIMLLPLLTALAAAIMWISARSLKGESPFAMGFYPYFITWILTLPFLISDFQIPALGDLIFFFICGMLSRKSWS